MSVCKLGLCLVCNACRYLRYQDPPHQRYTRAIRNSHIKRLLATLWLSLQSCMPIASKHKYEMHCKWLEHVPVASFIVYSIALPIDMGLTLEREMLSPCVLDMCENSYVTGVISTPSGMCKAFVQSWESPSCKTPLALLGFPHAA